MIAVALLTIIAVAAKADSCIDGTGSVLECPQNFYPKPRKPSDAERKRIEDLIREAQRRQLAYRIARSLVKKRDDGHLDVIFQRAEKRAREEMYEAYNSAITATVDAYELRPPVTTFRNDPRVPLGGKLVLPWAPRFSENEIEDPVTGLYRTRTEEEKGLENRRNGGLGIAAARTWENGIIPVFAVAFETTTVGESPADVLASTIHHESIHWVQAVRYGGAALLPSEQYKQEELAYREEAALRLELRPDLPAFSERKYLVAHKFGDCAYLSENKSSEWVDENLAGRCPIRVPMSRPALTELDPGNPEASRIAADEEFLREIRRDASSFATPPVAIQAKPTSDTRRTIEETRTIFSSMRYIVAELCRDPRQADHRASEFGALWLRGVIHLEAVQRESGGRPSPVRAQELYQDLAGCDFEIMKQFLEKPLWSPLQDGDSGWARMVVQGVHRKYHASPDPGPPSQQRRDQPEGSRAVTPRFGPAYRQAEGWKR